MYRIMIILLSALMLSSCIGRGSGPLQREDADEQGPMLQAHSANVENERIPVLINPCNTCTTISDLMKDRKKYSGKRVEVKGIVTKFNPQIMDRNWVHIQDGSEFRGAYDLTVTTADIVQVGDTVTFEGKISLEKDLGYGYFYPVIMEEGVLSK